MRKPEYLNKEAAAKLTNLSVRRILELSHLGKVKKKYTYDQHSQRRVAVFLRKDLEQFKRPVLQISDTVAVATENENSHSAVDTALTTREIFDKVAGKSKSHTSPAKSFILKENTAKKEGENGEIAATFPGNSLIRQATEVAVQCILEVNAQREKVAAAKPTEWMTLAEADLYIGLPEGFLLVQVKSGKLPALDVGVRPGGRWRVSKRDLEAIAGERLDWNAGERPTADRP